MRVGGIFGKVVVVTDVWLIIFVRTVVLKVGFLLIVRSCSCISSGNDKVCSKTGEAKFQNVYIYLVDGSEQVRKARKEGSSVLSSTSQRLRPRASTNGPTSDPSGG
jgi:hypothetical protein